MLLEPSTTKCAKIITYSTQAIIKVLPGRSDGWVKVCPFRSIPSFPVVPQSRWAGRQTWVSPNGTALALLGPVPVQSRPGRELQLLLQAQHLRVIHALLFLQLPLLPQLQDALLLSGRRGAPDEPLKVVAHRTHHKRDREGHIRGIGPCRRPENRPHDCTQPGILRRGRRKTWVCLICTRSQNSEQWKLHLWTEWHHFLISHLMSKTDLIPLYSSCFFCLLPNIWTVQQGSDITRKFTPSVFAATFNRSVFSCH